SAVTHLERRKWSRRVGRTGSRMRPFCRPEGRAAGRGASEGCGTFAGFAFAVRGSTGLPKHCRRHGVDAAATGGPRRGLLEGSSAPRTGEKALPPTSIVTFSTKHSGVVTQKI